MEPQRVSTAAAAPATPGARTKATAGASASAPGGADGSANSGDFFAMLCALDSGLQPETDQALVPQGTDPAAWGAWPGHALAAMQPDDGTLQGAAQSLLAAGGSAAGTLGVWGAGLLPPGSLVAQTAVMDAAGDVGLLAPDATASGQAGAPPAGYRRNAALVQGGLLTGGAGVATARTHGLRMAKVEAELAPVPSTAALQASTAVVAERRDAALQLTTQVPRMGLTAFVAPAIDPPMAMATETAPGGSVPLRNEGAGIGVGLAATTVGGAAYEPQDAPAGDASGAFADPGQAGAEDAVAEQVSYWVNQNLQNAELTVNHEGQPVQVSVSLSGKEAHVAFRSDQSQTRELLDSSTAQLRELLLNEGLVLSGVSVDSAAGQSAGSGQGEAQNGQAGGRRGRVAVPLAADVSAGMGVTRAPTDRTVDIFV